MIEKYKYVILGAGPSGLSFAHTLLANDENSFIVLEKENEAGGLCRSEVVDGSCLDIGGGHFLEYGNRAAVDFLFQFMPESEWKAHDRISRIDLGTCQIDYPFEANIYQLPLDEQIEYLISISRAGSVTGGLPQPKKFSDWILWKLGDRIANNYMLPYNNKIWSVDLDTLGTYWMEKLPDVSFRNTLQSCLTKRPEGKIPAHAKFYYPERFGYGEVWKRMGNALGERIRFNTEISAIDLNRKTVNDAYQGERIINTVPWQVWQRAADLPEMITRAIKALKYSSIDVGYVRGEIDSEAHWIYCPDSEKEYHRILCRKNFLKGSRGYWTETNSLRTSAAYEWSYRNTYAYPLNTIDKPSFMGTIADWAVQNDVFPLGRWGRWNHVNSDVAVVEAIALAKKLLR